MNILLTNKQVGILKESIEAQKISKEDFIKEVKSFLYNVLSKEDNKVQNNFWKLNGLTNSEVLNKLIRFGVVEKREDKLMVPKKNFERKVDRLYYDMFPEQEIVTEDGEGGGANTCSSVGGSYEVPFMSPINRKIG